MALDDDSESVRMAAWRAIRDAVVAGDDDLAEQLATRTQSAESVERVVVSAMDRAAYENGTYRRFTGGLIRWLRRAARGDQTWAIARIGVEWWPELSLIDRSRHRGDVTAEPEITEEEADRCLEIAAGRGHRRAAFRHDTLESLLIAYGDGTPDDLISTADLRSIEARVAAKYAATDDSRADSWFRRATASPRWYDRDGGATWLEAMSGYGRWAHSHGDVALCDQVSGRVVDDAVVEGATDRCAMAADAHKPYRDSFCLAASNESARLHIFRHLLIDHDPTPESGMELLRLFSRNHYFGPEEHDIAAAVWERRHGPFRAAAAVESHAWQLTGFLLTEVVPSVLRLVGCDEHAGRIVDVLATVDFSVNGFWEPVLEYDDRMRELGERSYGWGEPLDEVEMAEYRARTDYHPHPLDRFIDELIDPARIAGWRTVEDTASALDDARRLRLLDWQHPLERAGLDSVASTLERGLRPRVSEREDRLLGGSDAWLAMWLATSSSVPDGWKRRLQWSEVWNRISPMVAEILVTGAIAVAAVQRSDDANDANSAMAYDAVQATITDGVQRHIEAVLAAATT
ncbi:hypothetical protein Mvan_5957 [Mycolicibacterium vanbaalenii PYR-1]|uniref:Uncharacterized protein n=1 Tax=Mycolicibacterium vanbaalenii (strain DSM 7251 / JCM 13017 / BCRC 16820 / KCTC 9966 / NRRL B-24157 / PYR-1) TaxID=350058 RepID=A1THR5_MYCVP|nr:hypothetical protein [Mycolicibacterium vanbaalenii]ABM16715.1 hypothetical protein Mvan_5957 [Mycolicibacterium vanbaalenii PYR-1]